MIKDAISDITPIVDMKMNLILSAPYTETKIKKALFDMHPSKALGPDGFTALFFRKNWDTVGKDVTTAILKILNENGELSEWNSTIIVLIPKVLEPSTTKEFRPISLCNTCYKTYLARSQIVLNQFSVIIDQYRSAFVQGRLITDNVIIGFECMKWIRNNKKTKTGFGAPLPDTVKVRAP